MKLEFKDNGIIKFEGYIDDLVLHLEDIKKISINNIKCETPLGCLMEELKKEVDKLFNDETAEEETPKVTKKTKINDNSKED